MMQILDITGQLKDTAFTLPWNNEELKGLYQKMVLLRMADAKIVSLQRQGRCGTYASIEGQEAAQLGSFMALDPKIDWVFPAFRELAICYLHGAPLEKIIQYWMGSEWGSHVEANIAPVSIPVGSHPLHATGFAWGLKLQKKPGITISYFGDGATSTGDFYEAMNFAGVFALPTIFFCQNNQWAISVPRSRQSAAETLSQKAVAAGIKGAQVDGNDIFAVYKVMSDAVAKARAGGGATLIEAITYRFGNHTTSDDASRYRSPQEIAQWRARDPIVRFRKFLEREKLWSQEWERQLISECEATIRTAVEKAESMTPTKPEEIFDFMYEKITPPLEAQKEYLLKVCRS